MWLMMDSRRLEPTLAVNLLWSEDMVGSVWE